MNISNLDVYTLKRAEGNIIFLISVNTVIQWSYYNLHWTKFNGMAGKPVLKAIIKVQWLWDLFRMKVNTP